MSSEIPLVVQGFPVGYEKEFSAAEVGINGVSVKTVAVVNGNKLNVQGFKQFMATVIIDNTGAGSTGLAKLVVDIYGEDDVALLDSFDLVSAINLKADNTMTVTWGLGNTAKHHYTSGTPTLSSSADILRVPGRLRLSISTTEVSDATTVTGTVRLRCLA